MINTWQHNDPVHQRQDSYLAHIAKPVLGRGYVQDTATVYSTSLHPHIEDAGGRRRIIVRCRLHKWRGRRVLCRLPG